MKKIIYILALLVCLCSAYAAERRFDFNTATQFNDSLNPGYEWTPAGNPAIVTGLKDQSLNLSKTASQSLSKGGLAKYNKSIAFAFKVPHTPDDADYFFVNGDSDGDHMVRVMYHSGVGPGVVIQEYDGGAIFSIWTGGVIQTNVWYHLALVYETAGFTVYLNATNKTSNSRTGTFKYATDRLGLNYDGTGGRIDMQVDCFESFSETLTAANITTIYNNCFTASPSPPAVITFVYPQQSKHYNYNGTLSFTTDLDTNCTLNRTEWNGVYNNSKNYVFYDAAYIGFPEGNQSIMVNCTTSTKQNTSSTLNWVIDKYAPNITTIFNNSFWGQMMNLSFNVTDSLSLFNVSVKTFCNSSYQNLTVNNPYTFGRQINISNCTLGANKLNITACDNASNCRNNIYDWTSMARLGIRANEEGGGAISSFSIYVNGTSAGSTASGYLELSNFSLGYYNVSIDSTDYSFNWTIVNITSSYQNISFYLWKSNSVRIYVRDEATSELINNTVVAIEFSTPSSLYTYTTSNGTRYVYNLTPDTYSVKFNASGYSIRIYTLTITNKSTQILNAFLTQSTYTTIFITKDQGTTNLIQNVSATMYRFINTSWQVVEAKGTDITGRVQFSYQQGVNYKFFFSKEDYQDLVFYLNPVLYSEYNLQMEKIITFTDHYDYEDVSIIYSPTTFQQGTNQFTFMIQCPFGKLIDYGFNLTFPHSNTSKKGTNAIGEQLTSSFNITSPTVFDTVRLDYFYTTTTYGRRNFTFFYGVMTNASSLPSNFTMMENINTDYGLGIFERVLIMVLIDIFFVGIAALIGKALGGMILALFFNVYLVWIGFIEWWLVAIPIVILLFIMIRKEG